MLDVRMISADIDQVKAGLARRGQDTAVIDEVAGIDAELRSLSGQRD